jgi:hypothetical protein
MGVGVCQRQRGGQREKTLVYIAYIYMACISTESFWKAAKKLLGVHAFWGVGMK